MAVVQRVFNEANASGSLYRIKMQVYPLGDVTSIIVRAKKSGAGVYQAITTVNVSANEWNGVDITSYIEPAYPDLDLSVDYSGGSGSPRYFYCRNFQALKLENAEVQDSEMLAAGRRYNSFIGSKLVSQDINIDSPDTVDGGPVITINTVSSAQPDPKPLEGRAIVNAPVVGPLEGRAIVNFTDQLTNAQLRTTLPQNTTQGRAIVNVYGDDASGQKLYGRGLIDLINGTTNTSDGRAIVNFDLARAATGGTNTVYGRAIVNVIDLYTTPNYTGAKYGKATITYAINGSEGTALVSVTGYDSYRRELVGSALVSVDQSGQPLNGRAIVNITARGPQGGRAIVNVVEPVTGPLGGRAIVNVAEPVIGPQEGRAIVNFTNESNQQ